MPTASSSIKAEHVAHFQRHHVNVELTPQQFELMTSVAWISGSQACDLDLSCAMFDAKGKWLETIDFNDTKSNCGGVWSEGDAVGGTLLNEGIEREQMSFQLRTLNPKVSQVVPASREPWGCMLSFGDAPSGVLRLFVWQAYALVVWLTSFNASFAEAKVSSITSSTASVAYSETQKHMSECCCLHP